MEVIYKVGNITLRADVADVIEAFDFVSAASETFHSEYCGHCGHSDTYRVMRVSSGYKFRELRCRKCGYRLALGETVDRSSLFPRRYDTKTRAMLPNRGWMPPFSEHADTDGDDPETDAETRSPEQSPAERLRAMTTKEERVELAERFGKQRVLDAVSELPPGASYRDLLRKLSESDPFA